ncbi:MAG: PAS domain S-box protein [Chitinophagaceae bacterium]|nr:MAG: PAS domain S-box protein [Chitinophagaceae bacterium]
MLNFTPPFTASIPHNYMDSTQQAASFRFLQAGGQMGERIRQYDWSAHPMGPVSEWPMLLRSSLSICLNAGFPIAIYWGPELFLFYNDAWSGIPGDKHPWALGRPAAEVWPDIWDTVGPQFAAVLSEGRSFRATDEFLPMHRYGFTEETYFDYNLSPIFQPDGQVAGVFNAGIETTYRIVNERRNRFLHELLGKLSALRSRRDVYACAAAVIAAVPMSLPFALLYSLDGNGQPRLEQAVGLRNEEAVALPWPFDAAGAEGTAQQVQLQGTPLEGWTGHWPEPVREALLLPLLTNGQPSGYIVCGVSPRRQLDTDYRQFISTIALHINTTLTRVAAIELEEQAREELSKSEDNLRSLFMQAPMGICILRGEELYVELVNDAYLAIVQRTRIDFEHRPIWEGLPEVRDQGFDEILKNVLRNGEAFIGRDTPVQIVRNGLQETIYVDFVYEPLRERDGTWTRIMALVIDVTDKVAARRSIQRSEERARLAIDSADLGTFDVDLRTNAISASKRMADIMGITHSNDREAYVHAIHPDDQVLRAEAYKRAYADGYLQYEGRVVHPDGSIRWCRFKGRIFFEDGTPVQLLGVVQDITEIKEFAAELTRQVEERTQALQDANRALNRQNAELEQFAYVSSHDLQEPLRKIRMFADYIREQEYDNLSELSRTRFEKITAAADRMSRSLRDLLEYASLERAERREPVDLNDVLQQVKQDLELAITQSGALIESDHLPTLPAIPLQMHQLLYNLVNNALKFAREGVPPHVQLRYRLLEQDSRRFHELRVCDNGIGFLQNYADKIFTIFQRLHDRASYSGSGIGLALCKKVAENHGGSIRAEGNPGEGATFIVTLPAP